MDIISIVVGLVGGGIGSYFTLKKISTNDSQSAINLAKQKAELMIDEAKIKCETMEAEAKVKSTQTIERAKTKNEEIKRLKIQEVREKFSSLKSELDADKNKFKLEVKEREIEVVSQERELKSNIAQFKTEQEAFLFKESELEATKANLEKQLAIATKRKEELDTANDRIIKQLENIAKLTEVEAKEQVLEFVRAKAQLDALAIEKEVINDATVNANKEAKKIIIQSIQRMCAEYTIENTVTTFQLESDDIKGQIIGREGRNIRAIEAATGAELVVDDTPEAIVISSFDPIRREICRLALKKLVADGRIHPAKIEEVVSKVKKQLDDQIMEIGERAIVDMDIHGLNANLIRMIGRMRYRSSYGQNLLQHSIEVARLCGFMAAELGLNKKLIKLAKRAGLLHDIGKVSEEELDMPHALVGMDLCDKYSENPMVINAVGAHHDEIEMNNIISPIIQACDAISGARPGARREVLESYLKRIRELEELALSYDGVQKAFAIQAGRELRVIVESDKVGDDYVEDLSFMISQRIMNEMQYPGQVKVTVIRETRATAIAK